MSTITAPKPVRVIVARTAPFECVRDAAVAVRSRYSDARILVITQRGTEARVSELLQPDRIVSVPAGFFQLRQMTWRTWLQLFHWRADEAVLVDSETSGASLNSWLWLLRTLRVRNILRYSWPQRRMWSERWIRLSLRDSHGFGKWLYGLGGLLLFLVAALPAMCLFRRRYRRIRRASTGPARVLYAAHETHFNGSGVSLLATLRRLDRTRFHPLVCCPARGPLTDACRSLGVQFVIIPTGQLLRQQFALQRFKEDLACFVHSVPKLARLLIEERIDLVHTNTLVLADAMVAAWLCGVPRIWHFREFLFESRFWNFIQLKALHLLSDRIVVISDYCRRLTDPEGRRNGVVRIYNGLDPECLPAGLDPGAARLVEGLDSEAFIVGVLGTLMQAKGQHVLVRAMPDLLQLVPNALLVVVGRLSDSPYVLSLKTFIAERGLADRVRFLEHRPDVASILAACDVIVVPSVWEEPFGRVAIEAMAMKRPVVASWSGGLREIVVDGETGVLVPKGDTLEMAAALARLARSPGLRHRMGEAGRSRVEALFHIAETVKGIEQCYRQLLPWARRPEEGCRQKSDKSNEIFRVRSTQVMNINPASGTDNSPGLFMGQTQRQA